MKTAVFSLLIILAAGKIVAQNYQITFAGTGASSTIDSVKVENLSQCSVIEFAGNDTLNLVVTVGIAERNIIPFSAIVYPNPFPGNCHVEFDAFTPGVVSVILYDPSGKIVSQHSDFLKKGHYTFLLKGIHSGIWFLRIKSADYLYTSRLISTTASIERPSIISVPPAKNNLFREIQTPETERKEIRSVRSGINMPFNVGDTLKLTGISGNYGTIQMLFPDHSQTVTFPFTDCTDASGYHYAVVQIGSQLWMQQNLKATKYRDGSDIPNVPDSATWTNLTTGAYCNFHNLPEEGDYYGRLYNFYAVDDPRGICPAGWHVPSHSEWNILEKFLDSTVDTTALMGTGRFIGRILKEGCTTRWQYLDTTYGLNSAGFSALCANFRNGTGAWSLAPDNNHDTSFWTSTSYSSGSAWFRSLRWCFSDIYVLFPPKKGGDSVRCIKDN
jgi:uncharacterized protein (TIGR02145 family)